MIAVAILNAVTEYRLCERPVESGGSLAAPWPGKPSKAGDTMRELLAQPMRAALRSRVKDFGESAFIRGGLPEMHRLMRQVEDRAPDDYAVGLVNQWWHGIGAERARVLPSSGAAKPRSLPLRHPPSNGFKYRVAPKG